MYRSDGLFPKVESLIVDLDRAPPRFSRATLEVPWEDQMAAIRNAFGFVFTMTLAAVFLIVTGLIGYYPPAHMSLDAATWRGTWTGEILMRQVGLGIVLLVAAGIVALRINKRLAVRR